MILQRMSNLKNTITLVLILNLFHIYYTTALYFIVREKEKCYTIEQPRDTPMIFNYEVLVENEDKIPQIAFSLYYGNERLESQLILNKVISDKIGHIDFTTDNDGYFSYCLQSLPKESPTKFHLILNYGFDNDYYNKLVKQYNYDAVNLQVHKLNDMLTLTLNEADYQKHKEVEYHEQTENMNNAALWWPILQIAILIITGIYQVQHLKNFFKMNKLI